jgi:hypothetical protein
MEYFTVEGLFYIYLIHKKKFLGLNQFESKGFLKSLIQDFPIRGKLFVSEDEDGAIKR